MISEQHIAHAFDRDLESIQALIMKMGGLAEKAILDSAQALETRDEELANQVRAGDKVLDELEDRVHADCAQLIARRSPTAGDLRTVLPDRTRVHSNLSAMQLPKWPIDVRTD